MNTMCLNNVDSHPLVILASLLCLVQGLLFARQHEEEFSKDTLATIGPQTITVRDLDERIGLMPWLGLNQLAKIDSVKIEALNSLVAEKLLALAGTERRLTADPSTQAMRRSLERLLARDELYKSEVLDKIRLSSAEISSGLARYARQLRVNVVIAASQTNAERIHSILENRTQQDDSLQADTLGALAVGQDTVDIRFGGMNQELEDRAYSLHQGQVSEPFYIDRYGWVVLKFLDWKTNPDYANESIGERRLAVEKILKERKRDIRSIQYFIATLSPQSARVEPEALRLFADSLHLLIVQDSVRRSITAHYRSLPSDVEELRERLGSRLETVLVRIGDEDLTIGEAIEGLRYQAFVFHSLRRNDFLIEANEMLKKVVEGELLAREAMKRHLQNTANVRRDLNLWSDYWAANAMAKLVVDTIRVNDDETAAYLFRTNPALGNLNYVNIREIFSDSLRQLLQLAIRIGNGESMAELARAYTERKEWRDRDGQSGFFAIVEHPAIGVAAMNVDSGRLVGPLHTENGYSLFEVLGKRLMPGSLRALDSISTQSCNDLLGQKQVGALERYVATLADKFGVTIRYENLRKLQTRPFPMVTKRMIGFGGAIPATPPLAPLAGWTKKYPKVNQPFQ